MCLGKEPLALWWIGAATGWHCSTRMDLRAQALSTGCCAKEIYSAPRGSGHRDLTNSLNNIQSSLGCLAGSSGHRIWSEWTKPTSRSKPISRLSAFVFHFTWDQIFSQVFDGFPSHEMGKRIVCNFWPYQTMAGQAHPASEPWPWCCRRAGQTAQLPGAHGVPRQLRLLSWAGYSCVAKGKTKGKEKTVVVWHVLLCCGLWSIKPGLLPTCGAAPCDSSLSACVKTAQLSATSLIDKESAGG